MSTKKFTTRHGIDANYQDIVNANNITSNTITVSGNVNAERFYGSASGLTGTASGLTANVATYETITNATSGTYYPQLVSDTSGNLAGFANNALAFDAATGSLGIGMVPLGGPLSGGALQVYASSTKNYGTFDCETAGWGYLTFSSGSNIYGYIGPDVNTIGEMGVASVGDLVFSTDYVERLRINSSGNVGIGTTQANTKLHVNGTILSDKFDSIQVYLNDYGNISTVNVGTASISNTYVNYSNNTSGFGAVYGSLNLSRGSSSNTSYMYSYGAYNGTLVKGTTTNARFVGYGAVNQASRGSTSDDISTNTSSLAGSINNVIVDRYANSSIVTTNLYGSLNQNLARVGSSTNSFNTYSNCSYGTVANYSFSLTNHYGFYASGTVGATSGTGTAVVTNYYGLYLATPTVQATGSITNRYAIYSQDASSPSYFAGNVGIGTTPSAWKSSMTAIEFGYTSLSSGDGTMLLQANAYRSSTGSDIYKTTAPAAQYQSFGGAHYWQVAASGTAGSAISFTQVMTLTAAGNLGIGVSSPSYKLDVNGTAKANTLTLTANTASTNTTTGTLIVTGGVGISGALNATTKSFDIVHPSDPNKRLRYGSLESPYHGIRLTGKGKVINGKGVVTLPYYFRDLVREEDVNIQLTNIKHGKVLWVEDINIKENEFTVGIDETTSIFTKEYEFFWDITAERKDVPSLIVEE